MEYSKKAKSRYKKAVQIPKQDNRAGKCEESFLYKNLLWRKHLEFLLYKLSELSKNHSTQKTYKPPPNHGERWEVPQNKEVPDYGKVGASERATLWKPEKTAMGPNWVTCSIFSFYSSKIHIFIE